MIDVATGTRADKERLQTLGLDLTEHGGAKSLEVVLHGRADARARTRLRAGRAAPSTMMRPKTFSRRQNSTIP